MYILQPIVVPKIRLADQSYNNLLSVFENKLQLTDVVFLAIQIEFFTADEDILLVRDACLEQMVRRISPKQTVKSIQHYLDQGFSQVDSEIFFMNNYQKMTETTILDQDQLRVVKNSFSHAPHRNLIRHLDHTLIKGRPFFKGMLDKIYDEIRDGILRMSVVVERLKEARRHGCYLNPNVKQNGDGSIMITLQNV